MKNNYTYILSLLLSFLLIACGGSEEETDTEEREGIKITGNIKGAEGQKVSMWVFEKGEGRKVDSTFIKDGNFELWTETEELRQYVVQVGEQSGEVIYIFPDEEVEEVVIKGEVPGLYRNYTISGDQNSIDYREYWAYILPYLDREQVLFQKYEQTNPDNTQERDEIMEQLDSMYRIERDYAIEFIENKPASPISWVMLQEFYPPQGVASFDTTDLDYFDWVATEMRAKYPYSDYPDMIDFNKESIVTQMNQVEAADLSEGLAPELEYPNPDGELIALSSLKGKVVLIDFWASWCGPCRAENPNVVKTYNAYKDKGFTIYSVSLDNNKEAWVKAIEADNLTWSNHVSDLKGWQSEAAAIYGVSSIPATFLIDQEGRIIDQNLRGGRLEQKLKEILG
ncbi:MAG: TlpA disulfide reductase family protein [Crocinitomicaceae bacterium]